MTQDVLTRNNVKVFGRGTQPMVFAHGFGCDQNMWRLVTPAFEDDYRIVLFDYVGSGHSDLDAYDAARYGSLEGYAQDVLDVVRALDLRDVVLVAHSVSSMVSVLAANEEPDRFDRLVLIGPSPRYINDPPYVGGFERADIDGLLEMMDRNFIGWANFLAPAIMKNPDRPELGEELTTSFCSTDPVIARRFAEATFLSDNRADLPGVRMPAAHPAVLGRHGGAAGGGRLPAPRAAGEHAAGDGGHRPLPAHEPPRGDHPADEGVPAAGRSRLDGRRAGGRRTGADSGGLLDQAPCGFVSFADDGTITVANATLAQMLGYRRGELEGRASRA